MTVIELPDEQAAALKARAAAQGLTLEDWFKNLADEASAQPGGVQSAADIVLEEMRKVPADLMGALPKDGAHQHDQYLYGWPKEKA
jgi:plasmid stability protein